MTPLLRRRNLSMAIPWLEDAMQDSAAIRRTRAPDRRLRQNESQSRDENRQTTAGPRDTAPDVFRVRSSDAPRSDAAGSSACDRCTGTLHSDRVLHGSRHGSRRSSVEGYRGSRSSGFTARNRDSHHGSGVVRWHVPCPRHRRPNTEAACGSVCPRLRRGAAIRPPTCGGMGDSKRSVTGLAHA